MKKIYAIFAIIVSFTLLLTACGGSTGSTKIKDLYPTVMMPDGTIWKLSPGGAPIADGMVADQWTQVQPPSQTEIDTVLADWQMTGSEEVYIVTLDGDFSVQTDEFGVEYVEFQSIDTNQAVSPLAVAAPVKIASVDFVPPMQGTMYDPGACKAMAIHLFKRISVDGIAPAVLNDFISNIESMIIMPTIIAGRQGANGVWETVILKYVFQGINFVVYLGTKQSPNIIGPVNANKVTQMLSPFTRRFTATGPNGTYQGKGLRLINDAAALMKCLKDNWPNTPEAVKAAIVEHNKRYDRKVSEVPEFPKMVSVPTMPGHGFNGIVLEGAALDTLRYTDGAKPTQEEMEIMVGLGLTVMVIVDIVPGDEPIAVLYWAQVFAR